MSGDSWFKFYPSDWLAGTRVLSSAETGIYITLIAMMYERGAPLDMNRKRLARLCGATTTTFDRALSALIEQGKIIEDPAGLWNERVENEQKKRSDKREMAIESARARWEKDKENQEQVDANAFQNGCERDATRKPESHISIGDFENFWEAYPKRDGANPRKTAQQKYELAIRKGANPDQILAGVKAYAAEQQRKGKVGTEFVMQATKFLNQEIWRDYLGKPTSSDAKPGKATIESIPDDRWRREVQHFVDRRGMCQWIFRHLTPPPDDPATLVPPHILAEFNINRAA